MKKMKATLLLVSISCATATLLADKEPLPVFAISSGDVEKVSVVFSKDSSVVLEIVLTRAKASEFSAFTEENLGKVADVRIDGETVANPRLMSKITGGAIVIDVDNSERAVQLAKKLTEKK